MIPVAARQPRRAAQPEEIVVRRRDADRSARVAPHPRRGKAGGDRRAGTAARPAWRARQIVRVARLAAGELIVVMPAASSWRLVLPMMIAPGVAQASSPETRRAPVMKPVSASVPAVVGMSTVSKLSFTTIGMPWSGPRGPRAARSRSSASAISSTFGGPSKSSHSASAPADRRRGCGRGTRAPAFATSPLPTSTPPAALRSSSPARRTPLQAVPPAADGRPPRSPERPARRRRRMRRSTSMPNPASDLQRRHGVCHRLILSWRKLTGIAPSSSTRS